MKEVLAKKVLDKGLVRLVDWMGSDSRIVDAARVSYQQGTKAVSTDKHLIRYLLRNKHTTPLEKVRFEFHVKLPIFIARQWMRHRMGSFNEISARYSELDDAFYTPAFLRKQSSSNKQGSSSEIIYSLKSETGEDFDTDGTSASSYTFKTVDHLEDLYAQAYENYQLLLENGVAREQARMVLPIGIYTEFYWTVDLWNLMHFLRLRLDSHAQQEIRDYAQAIFDLIIENCDLEFAMEAFQDYILDAPDLTKYELDILSDLIKSVNNLCIVPIDLKEAIKARVELDERMSKREKSESKLLALFGDTDAQD